MEVYEPYLDQTITFTALNGATVDTGTMEANLYFEDGHLITAITGATTDDEIFTFDIDGSDLASSGTYRLKLVYEVSGNSVSYPIPFEVSRAYTTNLENVKGIAQYDETYAEQVIDFNRAVQDARRIIDTFCGQAFQIIFGQARTFDGNGRTNLYTVNRLDEFTEVLVGSSDQTINVELDPASNFWLRTSFDGNLSSFTKGSLIQVTGNWGYQEPPYNVQLAGDLLIPDLFDDVRREKQTYHIEKIWQNTNRLEFIDDGLSTTGNQDADLLLLDYVLWTPNLV